MISSIEITRFRGIREGKLEDLTPLVVLVGPNGCGKSTVLDALLIGGSPKPDQAIATVLGRHPGVDNGARWFFWRADSTEGSFITVATHSGNSRTCVLKLASDTQVSCSAIVRDPSSVEQNSPGRAKPRPTRPVPNLQDVPDVRLIEPRVFDKQFLLHRLYTRTVEQGRRNQAKAIVTAVVPSVTDLEILTEGDRPTVHLVFENHSVPAAFAGDGVYSLVQLSLELASRPKGVVLLEEPEIHQHPAAIQQTVRAILAAVRRDIQVVLTTHSLELIDSLLAEATPDDLEKTSLYRLQLKDGALRSVRLSGSEIAFARGEIDEDLR